MSQSGAGVGRERVDLRMLASRYCIVHKVTTDELEITTAKKTRPPRPPPRPHADHARVPRDGGVPSLSRGRRSRPPPPAVPLAVSFAPTAPPHKTALGAVGTPTAHPRRSSAVIGSIPLPPPPRARPPAAPKSPPRHRRRLGLLFRRRVMRLRSHGEGQGAVRDVPA